MMSKSFACKRLFLIHFFSCLFYTLLLLFSTIFFFFHLVFKVCRDPLIFSRFVAIYDYFIVIYLLSVRANFKISLHEFVHAEKTRNVSQPDSNLEFLGRESNIQLIAPLNDLSCLSLLSIQSYNFHLPRQLSKYLD